MRTNFKWVTNSIKFSRPCFSPPFLGQGVVLFLNHVMLHRYADQISLFCFCEENSLFCMVVMVTMGGRNIIQLTV